MKFSIGDKIVLNRTGEEGHVSAYINQQMIEVEVGGTVFPVHMEDIDHPYLKWFTDKTKKKSASLPDQLPVEKIADRKRRLAKGIYLSFMPVYRHDGIEDVVEQLKIFLLNEMPVPVKFMYDVRFAHQSEFKHEGTLHAFGNVYLHSISYPDMNDQPRFNWQMVDTTTKDLGPEEGILRIKPAKLFDHISSLQLSGEATFSYLLTSDFKPPKPPEPVEQFVPVKRIATQPFITTKTIEAAKYEVDLHIEALIDNKKGLTNADIVQLQLGTLQRYVQLSIVHRQERMIVIHGLGKGKLREEVHAILKRIPEVSRFKNEWSAKYGFGATEIWFRY